MGFSETIRLLLDVDVKGDGALKQFRSNLSETDGVFNRVKVAGSTAFDFIGRHAATFALGAGGAIAGFAAHALSSFNSTALGAGQLRDSLGVTAEEASRLQEVAGDLGIGVDSLETTIGRMNRTAATTPQAFDEIGASIARNRDGTVNVTETFLNTIDALNRIPDASQRAQAAQEIFGRSWQDIAELVSVGADGVRDAMAGVEKQKIINDAEVARAREFRDMMDDLRGKVESLTLAIGEGLADSFFLLQTAAEKSLSFVENRLDDLSNLADNLWPDDINPFDSGGPMGSLAEDFGKAEDAVSDFARGAATNFGVLEGAMGPYLTRADAIAAAGGDLAGAFDAQAAAMDSIATGFVGLDPWLGTAAERQAALTFRTNEATEAFKTQADAVRGSIDAGLALRDAQRDANATFEESRIVLEDASKAGVDHEIALDNVSKAAFEVADAQVDLAEKTAESEGRTLSASEKVDILKQSLRDQASQLTGPSQLALLGHIATLDAIPPDKSTDIRTTGIDLAKTRIQEHIARLDSISETELTWIQAAIDRGAYDSVERLLAVLSRPRSVTINPRYGAVQGAIPAVGAFAKGGRVGPGGGVAGEAGDPELLELPDGKQAIVSSATMVPPGTMVTPLDNSVGGAVGRSASAGGVGGGGPGRSLIVNNYFPPGVTPSDVVNAQRRNERLNGTTR
jgi:hypothetical protein